VRAATIQSLRFLEHGDALALLHRTLASDKKLRKDEQLTASLIKAIGQHSDPSSVDVLADHMFETKDYEVNRARILGLGRIRTREALAALLALMKGADQHTVDRFMAEFRLSLMVLTGLDRGPTSAPWQEWWRENEKSFRVSADPPALPRPIALRWANYWGTEEGYGRTERREDRGDDPQPRRRGRDGG